MGSPVSSIFAEFKLRPLQGFIFSIIKYKPRLWLRMLMLFLDIRNMQKLGKCKKGTVEYH